MKKGQNECAIAFGIEAQGEELGFRPKITLFLSLRTSLGPVGVLPSTAPLLQRGSDCFLGIYSKLMYKKSKFSGILEKQSAKTTSRPQNNSCF